MPGPDSVECQVVSVDEEDGTNVLYCNARSPLGYRVQALSLDDGAVFQEGQLVQRLVEPRNGCHGSVVGFPAPIHLLGRPERCRHPTLNRPDPPTHGSSLSTDRRASPDFLAPTWVVYSHPTRSTSRMDLGVYLSLFPRDPDSWRGPWVIYEGPSAYSDLAHLELPAPAGAAPVVAFACLFECGAKTAYDQICFCVFTLYELIDNLPQNVQQPNRDGPQRGDAARTGGGDAPKASVCQQVKEKKKSRLTEMCSVC